MSDTIHISDFEQPAFEQGMLDIIKSPEEVPIPLDNKSLIGSEEGCICFIV